VAVYFGELCGSSGSPSILVVTVPEHLLTYWCGTIGGSRSGATVHSMYSIPLCASIILYYTGTRVLECSTVQFILPFCIHFLHHSALGYSILFEYGM